MINVNVTPVTEQVDVNITSEDISCDVVIDVNTVTIDVDVDPAIAVNKGDDGDSAYEVAVNNGFVGTEADWLASLVGADGQDGVDGTNGTNGQDGADGDSAYDIWINEGNTGTEQDFLDSLQGEQGIQGIQGIQGNDGADGQDGVDGTNGTNGVDGADGADGLGFTGGSYNAANGIVTFTSDDGLGFSTGDLRGADGQDGTNGTDGTNGQGVPVGGSAGEFLEKIDSTDYNTQWTQINIPTATSDITNDSGFITASSTDTLTNKSGSNSQWTNDEGYINSTTGDWSGTFDGQEGSYYLDYNNLTNTPTIPSVVWTSSVGDNTTQGANTWYKVATYNITTDFSGGTWVYHFNSSNTGTVTSAEVAIHLRRNASSSLYNVDIDCRALTHLNGTALLEKDSFLIVSNDATDIELWVQKKQNFAVVNATLISERQNNTTVTYEPDTNSWTSTTPSGTGDTEQSGAIRFINNGGTATLSDKTVMVVGDSTTDAALDIIANSANSAFLNFSDNTDEDVGQIEYDHSTDTMKFKTDGTTRLTIDNAGNAELVGNLILDDGLNNHTTISQHPNTASDVSLFTPASGGVLPVNFTDGSGGNVQSDGNGDVDLSPLNLGSSGTSINFFQVQDSSGAGQTLTSIAYVDVNSSIWSTAFVGTGFSWDGAELTVDEDSDAIEFNASIQGITANNNRVELGVKLMEDTGSGYTEVALVSQYAIRNNTQNEGNVTLVSFYRFNVASGTKYKIQVNRVGATSDIGTQGGTYFNAKRFS